MRASCGRWVGALVDKVDVAVAGHGCVVDWLRWLVLRSSLRKVMGARAPTTQNQTALPSPKPLLRLTFSSILNWAVFP